MGHARRDAMAGLKLNVSGEPRMPLMETSGAFEAPRAYISPRPTSHSPRFERCGFLVLTRSSQPLLPLSGNVEMPNVNKFPSSKLKLDEFFLNWLSSQESQKLVSDSDATQVERPHVFSLASRAVAVAVEDLPNDGTVRSPNPSYSLFPP